jgi:hypothetical protein
MFGRLASRLRQHNEARRIRETLFRVVGSTDAPARNRPTDLSPGLIAVPVPTAVLFLMQVESVRGLKRGEVVEANHCHYRAAVEMCSANRPAGRRQNGHNAREGQGVHAFGNLIRPYRSIAWTVQVLPFFVLKVMSS